MAIQNKITASFFIGLFVIVGFGLIVATIVWFGTQKYTQGTTTYVTYFDGSVEGLEKGSPVKYLGVPVGTVDKIKVAPDGKLIEVTMQIQKGLKIDSNIRVKAELAGISGGKFLQLSYPESKDLLKIYPKLTFEPPFEVIKSSPSGIQEIEIAAREVMNNLRTLQISEISQETLRLLESASYFFENQKLYDIIKNINEASMKLDRILYQADTSKFIVNIENSSERLLETTEKLYKFSEILNTEIKAMNLSNKTDTTFALIDSTIIDTRKSINKFSYRIEDILLTLNETLHQLQSTNRQLKKTLKAYTNYPGLLLFAEPPDE